MAGRSKVERDDARVLSRDNDMADKNGKLFKSGTKEKQHIVAIEPYGTEPLSRSSIFGRKATDHLHGWISMLMTATA